MNCEAIQKKLYEAACLDHLPDDVKAHIAACASCRACRDDLVAMLGSLGEDSVLPDLPDGFELSLRRELSRAAPPAVKETASDKTGRLWRRTPLAAAVAMAAMLLVTLGVWTLWRHVAPGVSVSHQQLHVAVTSEQHVQDARFEVVLPPGVSVAPELIALESSQNVLKWRGELKPGHNELDLPLVRRGTGPATIRVSLTAGGRRVNATVGLAGLEAVRARSGRLTLAMRTRGPRREVVQ